MLLNELVIDFASPTPVYEQIKKSIKQAIARSILVESQPLPSIRDLASFLKINPNTVARAYRELESAAIVETRGRFGTFIARYDPTDAAMAAAAREYVQVARGLGLGKAEALRYIEAVSEDRDAR